MVDSIKPITGEIRKYARVSWDPWPEARDRLYGMCDAIDAVHTNLERENESLRRELDRVLGEGVPVTNENMEAQGLVRLPVDADKVPINVGDMLTDDAEFKSEGKVIRLMLEDEGWMVGFGCGGWTEPSIHEWHHYHAPTVEDVLLEFASRWDDPMCYDRDEMVEQYATKLRLVEGQ